MRTLANLIRTISAVCLVWAVLSAVSTTAAEAENNKEKAGKDTFSFKWAFLKKTDDGDKVLDFKETPTVKAGDKLRIYFQPVANVYIYLYMFDAQKNLTFVFPDKPSDFENAYKAGAEYMLPSKETWFKMDDSKGLERFYLLASTKRLKTLEKLTADYLASGNNDEAKAKVLEEINNVQKEHSTLTAPAEKSVAIAGSVVTITRGNSTPDTSKNNEPMTATLVDGETFYAKTLRLKHE